MSTLLKEFNILIDHLISERNELLEELRKECSHVKVTEVEYVSQEYGNSTPPRRICEACGIEEDGWNCGYKVLVEDEKRNIRIIFSWDEFYKLRQPGPLCKVGNSLLK